MKRFYEVLEPGGFYHIYNRAGGSEKLFISADNYDYFLHLFHKYIEPVSEGFAYSLLPNHFHFFLRILNEETVLNWAKDKKYGHLSSEHLSKFLLKQFGNFFNAYSKAFNKQQNRKGRLFIEPFCRRVVDSSLYYTKLIQYIHANPVNHGICNAVHEWPYSSFQSIVEGKDSWLQAKEVIAWFGSVEAFREFHEWKVEALEVF